MIFQIMKTNPVNNIKLLFFKKIIIDINQRGKSCNIENKLSLSELKSNKNKIYTKYNISENVEQDCKKEKIDSISQKKKALKEALHINDEVILFL